MGMTQFSLRELQMLAEAKFTVQDSRNDLGKMTEFFRSLPTQKEFVDIAFVQERKLPWEIAEEQKVFGVTEDLSIHDIPREFRTEALGMVKENHIVFLGRLVYPVFDVKNCIMGFCGWDKYVRPKYLDSANHGYKAKVTTVYGMEKLNEYYKSKEAVYVTEGIVCCLYLRSKGLQALALLGSSMSAYVIQILNRFGSRLVLIPDNDAFGKSVDNLDSTMSGEHLVKRAKQVLTKARIIQSCIAKDIDDSRMICNKEELLLLELKQVTLNPFLKFQTIRVR